MKTEIIFVLKAGQKHLKEYLKFIAQKYMNGYLFVVTVLTILMHRLFVDLLISPHRKYANFIISIIFCLPNNNRCNRTDFSTLINYWKQMQALKYQQKYTISSTWSDHKKNVHKQNVVNFLCYWGLRQGV